MPSEERQRIIEANKSLRLIKNELEALLEKGVITDSAYDSITTLLPAESPLSGNASARTPASNGLASPAQPSPSPATPVNQSPRPPTYALSTGVPPQPPARTPSKPVLAYARALYRYAASDAHDCSFERDDRVAVFEWCNGDWGKGQNLRTGQEGIFPRTYVAVEPGMGDEKQGGTMPVYGGHGADQNPYNSNVPPMAVAAQGGAAGAAQGGQGKLEQGAKRFGKKLGNAAIFGAGMTIGGDIVNSIL